jgi:WD40 repeat protein
MGPKQPNAITKKRDYLSCIKNCFGDYHAAIREVIRLKNGNIFCFDCHHNSPTNTIKIYSLINNKFSLETEISIKNEVHVVNEIDNNIILLVGELILHLLDIKTGKIIQSIPLKLNFINKTKKLSNGLIAVNTYRETLFYKYDKSNKKLKLVDKYEYKLKNNVNVYGMWEINNEFLLFEIRNIFGLRLFNHKTKETKTIKLKKNYESQMTKCNVIDNHLFVCYSKNNENVDTKYIDIYNIELDKITFHKTIEFQHRYLIKTFIKVNEHTLIANDWAGNICLFNVSITENGFDMAFKDVFRAHEGMISSLSLFDDNKVLSISDDGDVKLWEFK